MHADDDPFANLVPAGWHASKRARDADGPGTLRALNGDTTSAQRLQQQAHDGVTRGGAPALAGSRGAASAAALDSLHTPGPARPLGLHDPMALPAEEEEEDEPVEQDDEHGDSQHGSEEGERAEDDEQAARERAEAALAQSDILSAGAQRMKEQLHALELKVGVHAACALGGGGRCGLAGRARGSLVADGIATPQRCATPPGSPLLDCRGAD